MVFSFPGDIPGINSILLPQAGVRACFREQGREALAAAASCRGRGDFPEVAAAPTRQDYVPAMRLQKKVVMAAACATLALAAGCSDEGGKESAAPAPSGAASKLFPDAFKGVCSGAGVPQATAFDPAAKTHKALLFQTYTDDLQDQSHRLPPAWTVQFSPNKDALTAIDVVICAKRTEAELVKTCDGYKSDGKPTDNKVRWHTASYEVSAHEAKTGKELASKTLGATDETCPMFASFDGTNETIDDYATPSDSALADFAKPFTQP